MILAWRAASTSNVPDPPLPIQDTASTFVKYSPPTASNSSHLESSYSAPLDLSQPAAFSLDSIPEPPSLPVAEVAEAIVGEPSFASLGLGGWSPVGIVQNCMEYLHIGLDIPWWGTIMIGKYHV
jgi:YidC/Oxa1 family membrane protein insertase